MILCNKKLEIIKILHLYKANAYSVIKIKPDKKMMHTGQHIFNN